MIADVALFVVVWVIPCAITVVSGLVLYQVGIRRGYHRAQLDTTSAQHEAFRRGWQLCAAELIKTIEAENRAAQRKARSHLN